MLLPSVMVTTVPGAVTPAADTMAAFNWAMLVTVVISKLSTGEMRSAPKQFGRGTLERPAQRHIIGTNEVDELQLELFGWRGSGRGSAGSRACRLGGYGARTAGVEVCNRRSRSACRSVWVFANMCCKWVRTVGSLMPSMSAASFAPNP